MLDEGLNSIRNQGEVSFGKTKTGHIAFADDLVIFANNGTQIYQKIMILAEKLQRLGFQVNESAICHLVFPRSHSKWVSNFEELVLTQASKVCSPVSVRGISIKTLLTRRCIF